jgi:hypothetical protein
MRQRQRHCLLLAPARSSFVRLLLHSLARRSLPVLAASAAFLVFYYLPCASGQVSPNIFRRRRALQLFHYTGRYKLFLPD